MSQVEELTRVQNIDHLDKFSAQDKTPLIVDLDGTLIKTDSLHETILYVLSEKPQKLLDFIKWLSFGKAGFKAKLAEYKMLDPAALLYRKEVIAFIKRQKVKGRQIFLVSAAHQSQVDLIANHLGLFDEAIGTSNTHNLAAQNKAEWLVQRFGKAGFDYIGNSKADLDVWAQSRIAFSVDTGPAILKKLDENVDLDILVKRPNVLAKAKICLKAMRPHQWVKNTLVFLPALGAHDPSAFGPALIAFITFCLAASAIYLINDMLDIKGDRAHPRKCNRPIASGALQVAEAFTLFGILILTATGLAMSLNMAFFAVLMGYIALTTAYSFYFKRKLMIDICTLGALYTIRIIGGGVAAGIVVSEWLLGFSMFLFTALASIKRLSELVDLENRGLTGSSGRGYHVGDTPVVLGVALAAGFCSVLVLALYISGDAVQHLYGQSSVLWFSCPLLMYWISRATIISYRGEMEDDPIVFAFRDFVSRYVFLCVLGIFLAGALL